MTNDGLCLADATLIIDQRVRDKRNKQSMTTYSRKAANETRAGKRKIKTIRYHEPHRDNLLQAVDMVAGAVFTHYRDGNTSYTRIIRSKIDDIWELNLPETQSGPELLRELVRHAVKRRLFTQGLIAFVRVKPNVV